ncbi:MAG: GGDEF domain-containing protein [Gammaproteobacteria bacterium]|nr:GGDEF domain-containing protein [Gammaproteobacteria bacterium]MBU1556716.1 GGDEF domain-containing protein [Gammaproteobacteria bacterium]MBU2071629.1 GGDEF domain-containing protein [Gammaproteobacteria bacterium]MBU2182871.1 GGDEF domain-containing protein [Gammaproteobacteria bacterium]MBU2203483.1 GGDEF domain-containing protein [Gammaproteobacteria bacterium]
MLKRLQDDFYLAMLTLVGAMIVLCITPYGIYRLYTGNYIVGIADLVMVLCAIIATRMAWRSGDTVKPGLFMALVFCAGAVLVCINLGIDGLFWVYPFLVFIFFLVSPLKAFVLLIVMLACLLLFANLQPGLVFASRFQMVSFVVTTTITSIFAFIFAYRTQLQRRELKRLATTDSLTGAANRRTLNDQLAVAINEHQRFGRPYGLILLDLDHFKQINDNYGHNAGDQVLAGLIPLLQSMLRQSDQVFRFGGEEFVVLLADIKPADLAKLAEKVRQGVAQHLTTPDGSHLTTSIGAAMLQPDEDWEAWLHRADMALYRAKHEGRNRVVTG